MHTTVGHFIESARETLQYINYYRLTAYALAFKQKDVYKNGLSFSKVYSLYELDKKLRGLTMGMIESIEIAFRTHIAYQLGHQYGPLGYRDPSNFRSHAIHAQILSQIDSEISRSRELFVSHHQSWWGTTLLPIATAAPECHYLHLLRSMTNLRLYLSKAAMSS